MGVSPPPPPPSPLPCCLTALPCAHRLEEVLALGLRTDEGITHEVRSHPWGNPALTCC